MEIHSTSELLTRGQIKVKGHWSTIWQMISLFLILICSYVYLSNSTLLTYRRYIIRILSEPFYLVVNFERVNFKLYSGEGKIFEFWKFMAMWFNTKISSMSNSRWKIDHSSKTLPTQCVGGWHLWHSAYFLCEIKWS